MAATVHPTQRVDQAYGPKSAQRIEVYPQAGLTGAPLLLFIHGGAWAFGDKSGVDALPDVAMREY